MMPYAFILVSILISAIAQIFLKLGTIRAGSMDILKLFSNVYTLSGLCLYGLSAFLWVFAISKVQLSFAYPMASLGYVIVFGLSYWIFGEFISIRRAIGLVTIVIGVVIIAKS
jgi:multidrug transporter EmrE-like cation transporter